jgi:GAF domain-containing protein
VTDTSPSDAVPSAEGASALVELVDLMLATPSMQQLLHEIARLAGQIVNPPAACGITLRSDGQTYTVATNGQLASHLDEVQYERVQGPCLHTLTSGQIISISDLATEDRWHAYRSFALGYGVRSSLSLPLRVEKDVRGALNLYALTPEAFGLAERAAAELFATQAAAAITLVSRQARHMQLSEQLRQALTSRAVIDQAIGIVMEQQHIPASRAFDVLRQTSQHQNRKLRAVAVDIVTAIGGEPPEPVSFHDP